ncbi:MAG: membrane protein insertion efficiency factor YidD [Deltaproteobacteria bacterium]|jgi:putative membrane protein insertion efficiency factor|nr:membrane protein insertion efficiency factor YidD [Deltaproteobacteria bacterium]
MKHFLQKWTTVFFLSLIRAYQLLVSPLLPPACRFTPTCSEYAIDAIKCYGPLRGFFMAAWRILRCHPLSGGGYDPVK